jgi:hypothetical protein
MLDVAKADRRGIDEFAVPGNFEYVPRRRLLRRCGNCAAPSAAPATPAARDAVTAR